MNKGDKVKMTEELKNGFIINDCAEHVEEFGNCIGIIEDQIFDDEPDLVNVRWQPSGLRYGYWKKDLDMVMD